MNGPQTRRKTDGTGAEFEKRKGTAPGCNRARGGCIGNFCWMVAPPSNHPLLLNYGAVCGLKVKDPYKIVQYQDRNQERTEKLSSS